MIRNNKRSLVVVFSICIGIFVGLVIASNFSWTQNSFADSEASVLTPGAPQSLPPIKSDLEATSRAFVEIAKRVTPTVVSITSEKVIKVRDPFSNFFGKDEFFKRFFPGRGQGDKEFRQNGLGSGIIISADGYILTNYHVIKDADQLNVIIDKKEYVARVVGSDPETDIAVVHIDAQNLPTIRFGDSDKLEVGELVLAIGSPFDLSLQHTVTSGIISAKGRSNLSLGANLTYQDFIQTDAAINPGNSGGALVNIRGELIGINTAIYAGNGGGNVGIGFAIPISLAKEVMDDLISGGRVVRGYLGVGVNTPDAELSEALKLKVVGGGAVIVELVQGTPAHKAGLKKYDVIIEVEGKKIQDHQMLTNLIASFNPGDEVTLKIIRDGKVAHKTVRLAERPSANGAGEPVSESSVTNQLGIQVANLTRELAERYGYDNDGGALVSKIRRNSVAAEKGLRRGDLIKEVDRRRVRSASDVEKIIESLQPGDIVLFQIQRQTSNHFIAMKVPKS
ncbi:MAG: Do family serine endopeptidase [Caldithrix sp.]|nr:MAG: Do family serine endopeptidase [Caldithrix sp.]